MFLINLKFIGTQKNIYLNESIMLIQNDNNNWKYIIDTCKYLL